MRMTLHTSYYGNPFLDRNKIYSVRISNTAPGGYPIDHILQEVIPFWDTIVGPFKDGKITEKEFAIRYRRMLDSRESNIKMMLETLKRNARSLEREDMVFLCYEKPGRFCHRHVLAEWLEERLGETVEEYNNPGTLEPTLF